MRTDINTTLEKQSDVDSNLLAAHAISGCDTVVTTFGLDKPTILNVVKSRDISLSSTGLFDSNFAACIIVSLNLIL